MNRRVICLFLNLFVCLSSETLAQQGLDSSAQVRNTSLYKRPVTSGLTFLKFAPAYFSNQSIAKKPAASIQFLPANFYANNLSFFCSKELQMEKVTKIPFRFRLGSVQYTDYMEGKNRRR